MVRFVRLLFPASVAVAVAVVACLGMPGSARADETSDLTAQQKATNDEITEQQAKASQLADESEELQAQLDALYPQIQETAVRLDEAQNNVASLVSYQYKNSSENNFLSVILSSTSLDDFITRVTYTSAVTDSLTQSINEVKAEEESLNSQKDELESLIQQKQQNQEDVTATVADLQSKNAEIDSRLQQIADDAAAQKAEQDAAAKKAEQVAADNASSGSSSGGTSGSSSDSSSGSSNGGSSSSGSTGSADTPTDSSWSSGLASGYDPDNDGTSTATGIPLDWDSYTVAIPMRWNSFWSYYYSYVEISYGGTTIVAQVTDCGGLPGGRVLDLSPACQRAFGASSSSDWGVRTVSYRFL